MPIDFKTQVWWWSVLRVVNRRSHRESAPRKAIKNLATVQHHQNNILNSFAQRAHERKKRQSTPEENSNAVLCWFILFFCVCFAFVDGLAFPRVRVSSAPRHAENITHKFEFQRTKYSHNFHSIYINLQYFSIKVVCASGFFSSSLFLFIRHKVCSRVKRKKAKKKIYMNKR